MTAQAPDPSYASEANMPELVDRLSQVLDLPIVSEYRPGVIINLERTATIAQLVLDFPLPETIEPAPFFQP
ncbi:DUF4089 domain-containing protein [Egbenema bharatensis]|uniref:DUF4089 domain-containing protein n=1 Tax=Egbenema bharatensis TaxID=3463334 RepID=UPI003A860F5F